MRSAPSVALACDLRLLWPWLAICAFCGPGRPICAFCGLGVGSEAVSVARTVLLKISDNQWLRANGTRLPFVRGAVSKFMPGEAFDDMLVATEATAREGIGAVFTRLGENVKDLAEADAVARHYLEVLDRIR